MIEYTIADLRLRLTEIEPALGALDALYATFDARGRAFIAAGRNPHLCHAGCSHCCRSGAVFAVTLAEAVRLTLAVRNVAPDQQQRIILDAQRLLALQREHFAGTSGEPDRPGRREDGLFASRIAEFNRVARPACPLLAADLCGVYEDRPLLCRAYGFPVDAYAVETAGSLTFRSLCHLYEGLALTDYLRARDVRDQLAEISHRLAGGRDVGRFSSPEAILARLDDGEGLSV